MARATRRRLTEDVLPVLRERAEALPIGGKMPTEWQIVDELGVSRQTAREAFAILQSEGYIEIKHGKGAFVVDKRVHDVARFQEWFRGNQFEIDELLEMRAAIEPYVAELAAIRITDEELAAVRASVDAFEEILLGTDVAAKVAADEEFHAIILAASRNKGLTTFYETFIPSLREFRSRVFSPPADPLLALPHHQRIYEALAAHDPELAHRRMREHIDHSRLDVARLAKQRDDR
ncbi:FadR/GntR family transcriptional regulator [uncultured Aeromicrobium sp.]|uniref:FadR/GntR family transcriptional regulator n=1 Tax=uncultured Aeromicrobium sp. TaxID=337820 RepID=UPI0025F447AF|nr:FCD domain-containing protein [uncultured Aeromicrobium sp.]